MEFTKDQKTVIKLATELIGDGFAIYAALNAIALLSPRYAAALGNNVMSNAYHNVMSELERRNIKESV